MRKLYAAAALAGMAIVAGGGGYALHTQAGPAGCSSPSLPSGDAIKVDAHGNAWTADSKVAGLVLEMVCTDGQWIHVSQYGN